MSDSTNHSKIAYLTARFNGLDVFQAWQYQFLL